LRGFPQLLVYFTFIIQTSTYRSTIQQYSGRANSHPNGGSATISIITKQNFSCSWINMVYSI